MSTALETRDEQSVAYDVVNARLRAIDEGGDGNSPDLVGLHLDADFVESVYKLAGMVTHATDLLKTAAGKGVAMTADQAARLWYAGEGLYLDGSSIDEHAHALMDAANEGIGALFGTPIAFKAADDVHYDDEVAA